MKRGELWSIAGGGDYAGKPRPALILQIDEVAEIGSVLACLLTSTDEDFRLRPLLMPSADNGLRSASWAMVDKMQAVPRAKFGQRIGRLEPDLLRQVERALLYLLGLG